MGKRGPAPQELSPDLPPEVSEALRHAAEVAAERRRLEQAYIDAIVEAKRVGARQRAIARAVGVGDETIRQMLRRHG